jgi:hypothetical protein
MNVNHDVPNDIAMGDNVYQDETLVADLTGTAASVTSASGETDDDSTKTLLLTVTDGSGESWDGVEQTVTYPASTDTALEKAAAINDQGLGIHADVDGSGHVVIVTDLAGLGVTIAIGSGTATMVWGTPVAGTGNSATWPKGTLLARNTSTTKMVPYADSGSNGVTEPVAVLPYAVTFTAATASGKVERVIVAGRVNKSNLSKLDDATAIGVLVFDKLAKNSQIIAIANKDLSAYDNE